MKSAVFLKVPGLDTPRRLQGASKRHRGASKALPRWLDGLSWTVLRIEMDLARDLKAGVVANHRPNQPGAADLNIGSKQEHLILLCFQKHFLDHK